MTTHDRQTTPLRWQMQFSPVRKCVPLARALVSKTLASKTVWARLILGSPSEESVCTS
ncbi:hypothetical protein ACIQXD_04690 [Streptomyces uncialis]|uniref:hypothetical protein n=1 Tax=Streptomyces uncialis TaxID=1048205 RepID=UPI003820F0B8